jgi:STE24 endopeptidase
MAQFDPAAATAAYLATVPPEVHAKATAYTQGGHWVLLWGALVAILISWLVLRSGVLVRIRASVESKKSRPWLAALLVLLADGVIETGLSLPWAAYSTWWREKTYDLTSQAFGGWLTDWALKGAIYLVITTLLLVGLYWLIRRAPRTWWAWGGLGVAGAFMFVLVISPVFIEPLLNTYKEAPAGPMRDAIVQMAKANGVPSDKIYIYDGSRQSNRYTANVSGLFGTGRIAMSDVMFAKGADLAEVRGVVGHEMGHYVEGHVFRAALEYGLGALVLFFLIDRLFPAVLRWSGGKGVLGRSDPAGFPVISMLLSALFLLATPLYTAASRQSETDADRYSLEHVNEPDGLAKALVKSIEYRAATPSKLEEALFYDHPSVGNRVRMCMDWKAAHPKKVG